jgi:SEC-C motif-containing protein
MRSRYSAFALRDEAYLLRTWHPTTRPDTLDLPTGRRWTRLRILATDLGGPDDDAGVVEFRAHFRDRGEPGVLTERSRFDKIDGEWYYLDGRVS